MISFNIIDASTNNNRYKGISDIDIKARTITFDNIQRSKNNLCVYVSSLGSTYEALPTEKIKNAIYFSKRDGNYAIKEEASVRDVERRINTLGHSKYPYTFSREYEAVKHFDLFEDSAEIYTKILDDSYITRNIKYTFGLEFETSMGFIPQELCFKNGLIPLRDGSISGTEYSTIVLNKPDGFSTDLLQQQLLELRKHCIFNKECALHIHMGGYPVNPKALFVLHMIEYLLESNKYNNTLPLYTFNTSKYKKNGKDYCKKIDMFYSFEDLYKFYARQDYYGDLTQPHPDDESRERKWQINTRYYGLNLINMLCYNGPKTVEFRFLRPTWNYRKIRHWLLVFNAVLQYCENISESVQRCKYSTIIDRVSSKGVNLYSIIEEVYSKDLAEMLIKDCEILREINNLQVVNGDACGQSVDIENMLLPDII